MGGCNGYEKSPVEAAIAGYYCAKTSIRVEFHGCRVVPIRDEYSPFSDLYIGSADVKNLPQMYLHCRHIILRARAKIIALVAG
jgi:hypothetical protein